MKAWILIAGAAILIAAGAGATLWADERKSGGTDPNDSEQVALGEELYVQYCASCHGADLEGQPNWREQQADGTFPAPPHDETGHTWHHGDAYLFDYTKYGGAPFANGRFRSAMPGFGDRLTDREIWAILSYIKSRWPPRIREAQERRSHQ